MENIIKSKINLDITDNLELELKNIKEVRLINKNVYDNVEEELNKREELILHKLYEKSFVILSYNQQLDLYKLLEHICVISNSEAVFEYFISLSFMDNDKDWDYDRGHYSIQISTYNIENRSKIGLSYSFLFKTKHSHVKEIIINSLGKPSSIPNKITQCWAKNNGFNLNYIKEKIKELTN
jgi:hypothetical protein